jgi:hypothetical protein
MYYRPLYDGGEILYHSSILSALTQKCVIEEGRVGDGGAQSTIKYVPYIYCHTYLCNNNFSFF